MFSLWLSTGIILTADQGTVANFNEETEGQASFSLDITSPSMGMVFSCLLSVCDSRALAQDMMNVCGIIWSYNSILKLGHSKVYSIACIRFSFKHLYEYI